jgi:hypothetical protein
VQAAVWVAVTWGPLLAFSIGQGTGWGSKVAIPLLSDPSVFGRFFVAIPLLISAEVVIGRLVRQAVLIFGSSGIIKQEDLPTFRKRLATFLRLRDSSLAELLLAVLACVPYYLLFSDYEWVVRGVSTWHGTTSQGLSPAGWWFTCVSSPILRFLMFRWFWRFTLWTQFVVGMSRLNLVLVPTHPDRLGGLGFLLHSQKQFGIVAAAMASVIAGQFANEIVYFGETFHGITAPAAAFVVLSALVILSPLIAFSSKLFSARYDSLLRNNGVARSVTRRFEDKWTRGIGASPAAMVGTQDPSSIIDYISTYDVIRETSVVPINKRAVMYVMVLTATPFASLWLLNKPLEQLITEVLKRLLD